MLVRMPEITLDFKTMTAIAAVIVGISSFGPYFVDIFKRRTTPHLYTWLIWFITTATGAAGVLYGHGGITGYGLALASFLVFCIFLLTFKYGTKNITRSDGVVLALALLAVLVWWQLENPVLSVLMVAGIDGLGFIPTLRKLWQEPHSESLLSWGMFAVAYLLTFVSLVEYNLLTVPFVLVNLVATAGILAVSLYRRTAK